MGLVCNSNTGKTEYLIDLEGGGGAKQSTLLSITTAPSGSFEKGSQYYNSNTRLIYTAVEDNTWTEAKTSDPEFGTVYIYDNQGTTEYYQWDGDNLVGTDLEKYQLISNISQDYKEDDETKYPSSKALSDGLKSVEPNLYDIRTLSQVITNKGWAYLCNSTKQMLPKAKIPTTYEDIEQKYLSADKELSAFQKLNSGHSDTAYKYFYNDTKQKYYYINTNNPYKIYSSITPNLASTTLEYTGDNGCSCWCAGNNIIVVARYARRVDGIMYYDFDIFNKNLTFLRKITINAGSYSGNIHSPYRMWFRRDTFIASIEGSYGDNDANQWVILIKDDINVIDGTFKRDFFGYTWRNSDTFQSDRCPLTNIINDKYVYMVTGSRSDNRRIYKLDLDTYELTLCGQRPNGTLYTNLCYYNNKFYIFCHQSSHLRVYESSDCSSWTEINIFDDESIGCIINLGSFCLCFGDYNVYSTTDFNTFTIYESNISTYSSLHNYFKNYIQSDDYFFVLCNLSTGGTIPYNFFGSSLIPKVYTDAYIINGTTVNIQYYKNEDWKICIAGENGTNDTNLDAIYNELGYENYWLLDRNNQQLCLPRNSNLYTQMYVGDDYEDITVPSGNSTRLLPQSNLITDMTSTSITFDSTNKVQPNTDYEYGELTTLTLDSSSIIGSKLGTTIKFQSGTTATIITDSSNIQWADRAKPEPSASKTCLIFIWDNTGFYKEW